MRGRYSGSLWYVFQRSALPQPCGSDFDWNFRQGTLCVGQPLRGARAGVAASVKLRLSSCLTLCYISKTFMLSSGACGTPWLMDRRRAGTSSRSRHGGIRQSPPESLLLCMAAAVVGAISYISSRLLSQPVRSEALVQQLIAEHAEEPGRDQTPQQAAGQRRRIARSVHRRICRSLESKHSLGEDADDGSRARCDTYKYGLSTLCSFHDLRGSERHSSGIQQTLASIDGWC